MPNNARIRITRTVNDDEIARQILPKMEAVGQAIGARAQRLVPKRTWALHDTIQAETRRSGSKITTTVGAGSAKVKYALYVERGTSKMAAQSYLRPAFAQVTGRDLKYAGAGIVNHGAKAEASRQRRRDRAMDRRTAARENRAES
jgi:HK97 gp10 family phage protein